MKKSTKTHKSEKKSKKKKHKHEKKKKSAVDKEVNAFSKSKRKQEQSGLASAGVSHDIPIPESSTSTARKGPMTKEEYEKQQNVTRRVMDPDTGRMRYVNRRVSLVPLTQNSLHVSLTYCVDF